MSASARWAPACRCGASSRSELSDTPDPPLPADPPADETPPAQQPAGEPPLAETPEGDTSAAETPVSDAPPVAAVPPRKSFLRRLFGPLVALLVVLGAGIWLGGHSSWLPGPVRGTLVSKNQAAVDEVFNTLDSKYYRKIDGPTRDAALTAAIASLGAKGPTADPYTRYIPKSALQAFNDQTNARFTGIGVGIAADKRGLLVTKIFDGSPAKAAGIQKGDVITSAGGVALAGKTLDNAVKAVGGPEGSSVKLALLRDGKTIDKTVKRAQIQLPSVEKIYLPKKHVGIVRINSFSTNVHTQVVEAVAALQKQGAKSLVLDLRENPGGLVAEAQSTASIFLKGGTVVTMRGRNVKTQVLNAGQHPTAPTIPIVVLVDENTASAAEILTGALQDRGRATVVGVHTYGKGVFQEIVPLRTGGDLDLTVGQYYTPKGHNLGGSGVTGGKDVGRGPGIQPNVVAATDSLAVAVKTAEKLQK